MGEGQSKLQKEGRFSESRESLSSTKDIVSSPHIDFYARNVRELKAEIANIDGILTDLKYEAYQVTLTNYSKEICNLQGTAKKKRARVCDDILKSISECLRLLVDKKEWSEWLKAAAAAAKDTDEEVIENVEEGEKASSIITNASQTPSSTAGSHGGGRNRAKDKPKTRASRTGRKSLRFEEIVLEELGEKVLRLRTDIDSMIELDVDVDFKEYERTIKDYYTELELISNPNDSRYVAERKDALCKLLIKYNNKLRKHKNGRRKRAKETDPQQLQTVYDIQNKLKELAHVVNGGGNKETEHVSEILSGYRAKVAAMEDASAEFGTIKRHLLDKLSLLEENLAQKRDELRDQIKQLADLVDDFDGAKTDDAYVFLDQNLRRVWSKLSTVTDGELIDAVKAALVALDAKARPRDAVEMDGAVNSKQLDLRHDAIAPVDGPDDVETPTVEFEEHALNEAKIGHGEKQLLKQVAAFDNHWQQLYFNAKQSTVTVAVLEAIEKVFERMYVNLEELADAYNKDHFSDDEQQAIKRQETAIEGEIRKLLPEEVQNGRDEATQNREEAANNEVFDDAKAEEANASAAIDKVEETVRLKRFCTFADLQNIQKEVNNISKELFNENIDASDLKDRLDVQRSNLQCFDISSNATLESTKEKILKNIDDTYVLVNDHVDYLRKDANRNSSNELRIYESNKAAKSLHACIDAVAKRVREFAGIERDAEDYRALERSLEELYAKAIALKDGDGSTERIKQLNAELSHVLVRNQATYVQRQSSEVHELKRIIEEVQQLKRTASDIDAAELREHLRACLAKVDAIDDKRNDKAQIAKVQIKQKILQYLQTIDEAVQTEPIDVANNNHRVRLETSRIVDVEAPRRINSTVFADEQTTMLESARLETARRAERVVVLPLNHPDNPYHQIEGIRHRLIEIKAAMDCFKGDCKDDDYDRLEGRILQCRRDLSAIDANGSKLIRTSKSQYADYIEKLLRYFEASVSGTDYVVVEQRNLGDELTRRRAKLAELQGKVHDFDGTKQEYLELKEELLTEKVALEYISGTRDEEELSRTRDELLKTVLKLLKVLKSKSKRYSELPKEVVEMEELVNIRNELNDIEVAVSRFRGTKNDANYMRLDEALIGLVIRLDKLEIGDDCDSRELKDTKSQLILQLQTNLNLLHDKSTLPNFLKLRSSELLTTDI